MKKKHLLLSSILLSTLLATGVAAEEVENTSLNELNLETTSQELSYDDVPEAVELVSEDSEVVETPADVVSEEMDNADDIVSELVSEDAPEAVVDRADDTLEGNADEALEEGDVVDDEEEVAEESDTLTIIHTNDIHGRILEESSVIGTAKLAQAVEESRQETPTFVFDSGDAFQGLPISNSSQGEDMAAIMNAIGYDAMAVGNHEFDFGLNQLKKLRELLTFPLLSANTYVNGARLFDASAIIDKTEDIEGDEVVVIGVTTPETATKTHPRNVEGVSFSDPISEVEGVIAEIEARAKAQGKTYNNYVILAHLGVDTTTPLEWQGSSLAQALSKNALLADKQVIILDGHSHTAKTDTYGHVIYNQTGSYLNNIGYVTLNSQEVLAGLLTAKEAKQLEEDSEVAALVKAIKDKYIAENAVVVLDNSPVELNGQRENVRVRETNLGNIVTDALYDYGQTGFSHRTDLAVTNGGGLRETIQKGKAVTKGDIIAVLPFGNIISQIQVTGQQIKDMFIKSLGSINQVDETGALVLDDNGQPLLEPSGGFLQVSGAKVYYDTTLSGADRILAIEILDHETNTYKALDLAKNYYLATNDFLAAGGDGYTMLGGTREEGPSMDVVFANFLAKADLSQYAIINPNTRTISISSSGFAAMSQEDSLVEDKTEDLQVKPNEDSKVNGDKTPLKQAKRPLEKAPANLAANVTYRLEAFSAAPIGDNSTMLTRYAGQYLPFTDGEVLTLPLTTSRSSVVAMALGLILLIGGLIGVRKRS
ncbi:cell surface ecto-5'-nucleotidase Nt5e [Streptococcus sp. zg-JUN1979]|uniref:cell surface ecto-5'-nucleotidase Nt5e n=1 Tax=Streptococcus sp. zg-JUN1979 TaxID=3391450 RepID=UPI0039A636C7